MLGGGRQGEGSEGLHTPLGYSARTSEMSCSRLASLTVAWWMMARRGRTSWKICPACWGVKCEVCAGHHAHRIQSAQRALHAVSHSTLNTIFSRQHG